MIELVSRGDKAINERYRPMKFSEVIGCEKTKAALANWMGQGEKRSKAVLLYGNSGGGKSTISRILAMGLNCETGDTGEPCLECECCKEGLKSNAIFINEINCSKYTTKE